MTNRSMSGELKALDIALGKAMSQALAAGPVPYGQAGVLQFLNEHRDRGVSQRQIERHFGISNPAASGIVKRLEAKELVQVTVDPADRRRHNVSITPDGIEAMRKADECIALVDERIFAGLSDRDRAEARRLVSLMKKNLTQNS
ncbi:MarR family winged helix-turn-helix transcriptional regulator [Propionibacterium australiense]|nr:MarR family transcriptional regulator [Propionibacterium australiense]SYZ34520.1 MarR-type HTH domain signature [Propionibacterium australiense]VEH89815.1 transcriptional regulator SlyA [Propionibacterium australiense]